MRFGKRRRSDDEPVPFASSVQQWEYDCTRRRRRAVQLSLAKFSWRKVACGVFVAKARRTARIGAFGVYWTVDFVLMDGALKSSSPIVKDETD